MKRYRALRRSRPSFRFRCERQDRVTSANAFSTGCRRLWPSSFIAVAARSYSQAVMFQHGGITAIGINSFAWSFPPSHVRGLSILVGGKTLEAVIGCAGFFH
jgi:hypothetical protein